METNSQGGSQRSPQQLNARNSSRLLLAQDSTTGQLGETMDFDQMYNARVVLDQQAFNDRLNQSRQLQQQRQASRTDKLTTPELHDTSVDRDLETALNMSDESSFTVTTGKIPLRQGMLFWIATHRGCYFWVRTAFQLVAFSLLIVTLVMLNEFKSDYWQVTVYLLVAMHATDLVSFSLDLISFARRNIQLLRYKIGLDILSFGLSLIMQSYFGASLTSKVEQNQAALGVDSFNNFVIMRQWLCLEVGLSYLAILSQLIFFTYVYCTINTNQFQEQFYAYRTQHQAKQESLLHGADAELLRGQQKGRVSSLRDTF